MRCSISFSLSISLRFDKLKFVEQRRTVKTLRVIQFKEDERGITFAVRVVPRASSSEIIGEHEGGLRIRIAAPPVEGAANRELVRLLAKRLKVPQNAVEIISGTSSRNKIIRLKGVTATALRPLHLKWTSPPKKN